MITLNITLNNNNTLVEKATFLKAKCGNTVTLVRDSNQFSMVGDVGIDYPTIRSHSLCKSIASVSSKSISKFQGWKKIQKHFTYILDTSIDILPICQKYWSLVLPEKNVSRRTI